MELREQREQRRKERSSERAAIKEQVVIAVHELQEKQRVIPKLVEEAIAGLRPLAQAVADLGSCAQRAQADWCAGRLSLLDYEDEIERQREEEARTGWGADPGLTARLYGPAHAHEILVQAGLPAPWAGVEQSEATAALAEVVQQMMRYVSVPVTRREEQDAEEASHLLRSGGDEDSAR